jgi:hypothetical protein
LYCTEFAVYGQEFLSAIVDISLLIRHDIFFKEEKMTLDKATKINVLRIDGVDALLQLLDGTLRVFLLTDTPEVREAVLQAIGDKLPVEKVIFEKNERFHHDTK